MKSELITYIAEQLNLVPEIANGEFYLHSQDEKELSYVVHASGIQSQVDGYRSPNWKTFDPMKHYFSEYFEHIKAEHERLLTLIRD